ncbi:MAG: family 78 glycoside hydrolase catalytic domain [Bacteroidetes bacterium]|nr:family 78 glycoside hydrolase catalytic domain [Bacteroidota bacterium]
MHKLSFLLIAFVILFSACTQESHITPAELLCEAKTNPSGIATTLPKFRWKNIATENKSGQSAYQILVASSPAQLQKGNADLWDSGKILSSNSVWIPYEGTPLQSRSVTYWKIKVWDKNNAPSKWSEIQNFSVGLLNSNDWKGEYIGMDSLEAEFNSPFLRKTFVLNDKYDELFLHVNSLGYHEVYVNNQRVGDAVLAPAESQFDKRSFSLSYDISSYLKEGKNAVVLWLGYGWYKHFKEKAHNGPLVKAQLEGLKNGKWETLLKTDNSWKVAESEYSIWDISKFGGEILDANRINPDFASPELDDTNWAQASEIQVPEHLVTPQVVELNRVQEKYVPSEITLLENGDYLVDMGKNLTGNITVHFATLPKGHEVTLHYSDFLVSKNKELFKDQFDKPGWKKPSERNQLFRSQTDKYISSGEKGVFTNKFNYRAFRYLKISNLPFPLPKDSISAHLIHTDFKDAASFSCSDELLNTIHDLFAHTIKCLTIGGKMVDCPHFERLGYGGDGNASTMTAQTLYNLPSLYTTWLTHWADCNGEEGDMPHTAPTYWSSGGGPYWCTFIIKAAWETYLNYGDKRVLETFYPNMLNWLGFIQLYSPNVLLEEYPTTENRNWFLGDWATPEGIDQRDPRSVGLVTNCAIVDSYDKMIKIAKVLNKTSDLKKFVSKKKELSEAVHKTFYNPESASYGSGVQIDLAYPLLLGITPDSLKEKVTASLSSQILVKDKGHLATGLVGLPIITQWVNSNNTSELMYQMMTKKDYPGYGYMLENGATTTWEHWRGERSRIHNCYNAPGSWYYQSIGGIQPLEDYPGYKRFLLAPRPPKAIKWAKVSKETPYGTIRVDWQKEQDQMIIQAAIPTGSKAKLVLPEGVNNCLINTKTVKPDQQGNIWVESGEYTISY